MLRHMQLTRACSLLFLVVPVHAKVLPVDSNCAADFRALVKLVTEDYAGFAAKTSSRLNEYQRGLERSTSLAESVDDNDCTAVLRGWITFFADRHLSLTDTRTRRQALVPRDNAPSLRSDGAYVVLSIPSFAARWKRPLDSLLQSYSEVIAALPYLIIDVRGNTGGGSLTYSSLLRVIYTDPIPKDDFETRASPGNIAGLAEFRETGGLPAEVAHQIDTLIAAMKRSPGGFVRTHSDRHISYDSVLTNPRRVAILVDSRCVSACELFVLDAIVSRKVVTIGSASTGGVLDYGDVRKVSLPSGFRRVGIPTARSRRLPQRPLDNIGIAPDVLENTPDADLMLLAKKILAQMN